MSSNEIDMIYKYFDSHFQGLKEDINELKGDIKEMKENEKNHFFKCPNTNKIQLIDDELLDYRAFKRYKKVFLTSFAVVIIIGFLQLVAVYNKAFPTEPKYKIEKNEMVK
ncbi:hypothetical protein E9993_01590 [Labilibacter sediminis]|nr:hypothetical protein E9993_01590 [Labilibacter sediminis]